jgi:hypothetical protein
MTVLRSLVPLAQIGVGIDLKNGEILKDSSKGPHDRG